ncbi:Acyl-CoA synthetase (AMP-forming)/AMP-acid ligase II [Actinokineospora alba]|uniref:Acyl-CoA synthetase (AMP-forming)/AMP-acid ligase II n=1 Tax=Actinokineospora alba TaxID=504798 RepID=A0A1H0HG99_9PSEU|nr:fatty acyl-AMP ligase [Actinokineospora alba]TDP64900.1 acyl-CoA synthetase (AMP-forming)/AMP-acid ligase II [Actinokineospora alba]SDH48765.1 Acyl-CoA synthetase (AMP-forming)/AMP-acid ligase II [Actinokineospora alba]SDO18073.1 Acyl-CoA synthetase (AMP-forming)/AMP-acid ligase II [Actinokineospora alba]
MTTFPHHVRAKIEQVGDRCSYTYVTRQGRDTVERSLTFPEVDERARALAVALAERDGDGSVLLMFPAGLEFVWSFLGCLYAGAVAIPTPLPSTDNRALERAGRIIGDAGVDLVLTDARHQPELEAWLRDSGRGGVRCLAVDTAELPDAARWRMPELRPDDVAYLQYTSGSTSEPRGVVVTHESLLHNTGEIFRMLDGPEFGVCAGWLPHYHDMGLVGQFLEPLYAGGSLVFTSPLAFVKRPALWLEMISAHRAGYTAAPNFAYQWCADHVRDEQLAGLDLSSLSVAMNGAEPVRVATLDKFADRFGPVGFRRSAWRPVYGMAETTLLVTGVPTTPEPAVLTVDPVALERDQVVPAAGTDATELVSCGRPVSLEVRIVDPRSRSEQPERAVGEIWVRGGSVAGGYWNDPEATAETFDAHLDTGVGPFLRTGDLGFLVDGALHVTGRLKDLIILNGRNLHPQDIEEAAAGVHPALGFGAAFAVDGPTEQVVLIQEVRPGKLGERTPAEVCDAIAAVLGDRLRLPDVSVVLVRAGAVERTTSGKVRRRRMRELFLDDALTAIERRLSSGLAARRVEVPA